MKKLLMLILALGLVAPAYANCGNDDDHGNGCDETT